MTDPTSQDMKTGWPYPKGADCPYRDRPEIICRCQDSPPVKKKAAA